MGVWDEFCAICGGPPVFSSYDVLAQKALDLEIKVDANALKKLAVDGAWTREWVGMASDGSEGPVGSYSCYGSFDAVGGEKEFFLSTNVTPKDIRKGVRYGVAAHKACVSVLRSELGYSLRFADVTMKRYNLVEGIDYSAISKYHDQDFDSLGMLRDGVAWMLIDPTKDERNRKRIVSMWQERARGGVAKKPAAKTEAPTKPAAKKAATKKEPAKKPSVKKPAAKKAAVKKAPVKKPSVKKPAAKKPAAKKR